MKRLPEPGQVYERDGKRLLITAVRTYRQPHTIDYRPVPMPGENTEGISELTYRLGYSTTVAEWREWETGARLVTDQPEGDL